jgi:predicted RNA binding protein YcfA (HicA-like mRNA interferase family)
VRVGRRNADYHRPLLTAKPGITFGHFHLIWYSGKMKVGEVLRLLTDDGWYLVTTRGSHRQLKHPAKLGRVTVAGKPRDDVAPGTLNSILKQAGLKK